MAAEGEKKLITLKSSDGEEFEVEGAVAMESQTIRHMIEEIEDDYADNGIPLPKVNSNILFKVIEYCNKHVHVAAAASKAANPSTDGDANSAAATNNSAAAASGEDLKNWDADFVNVNQATRLNFILVVTNNSSTLVANTSENEKNNKGTVVFVYAIADKMLPILSSLPMLGLLNSHGPNPLLRISDTWKQVIAAGGVISTIGGIILAGAASSFKERELPDHPGFVLISTMQFFILQYSVLAYCIILQGFECSSKQIIWAIGAFVELSIVAFWFAFQRQPMIVGLKWTKDAFEWMLKWTKSAFEWMLKWTKNAFEWMLKWTKISEWRPRF